MQQEPSVMSRLQSEVSVLISWWQCHYLLKSSCVNTIYNRSGLIVFVIDATQVDTILGDRVPTIEDMKKLRYTTRVINEVRKSILVHVPLKMY